MVVPQVLRTAFYFIQSAMTGYIVSVFPFRNRVSPEEAFEGLELGEGKLSRPVLRGPGGRKTAWLLDTSNAPCGQPGGLALFLSRSLFFFCESFHALLKWWAVYIVRIHHIPSGNMTGFMPHSVERFCFGRIPVRV
jgi:hypothetical protein